MSNPERRSIELEQWIRAPRARVFRAWSEPSELAAWAWGTVGREVEAESDFRVGGRFSISTARPDGKRWAFLGTFDAIEPERSIALSLRWDAPMGYDDARETLEAEFRAEDDGTRVIFRHEGEFSAEALAGHREGWVNVLETLKAFVEAHPA